MPFFSFPPDGSAFREEMERTGAGAALPIILNPYRIHAAEKTLPVGYNHRPSRSQKKRESTALQNMGEELAVLAPSVLEKMPLTPNIREALLEWQRLSSHEGRRRQMQYVGRLMREEGDALAVREALDALKLGQGLQSAAFKRCEKLRDDLMAAAPAETEALLSPYGEEDAAELRDLIARARNEKEHGRPPHAFRALFRKLKTLSEQ